MIAWLVLSGVGSAIYWGYGLPGVDDLPHWFFHTNRNVPLGPALLALVVGSAPSVSRYALALAARGKTAQALTILMLLGIALQFTLHFLVPEGFTQSLRRLFHGHGEFLRIAAERRGRLLPTLRDYDALFASGQLGAFAGTKGPGTLGFYMLVDAVAHWPLVEGLLAPLLVETRASLFVRMVPESAALVLVLFPVLTYLTLLPLVSLAKHLLLDERVGFDAALLYVSAPGMLLIDLHTDGSLYPLLGTSCVALGVTGARLCRPLASFGGGVLGSLGLYCTLGLLPCMAMAVLFAALTALQTGGAVRTEAKGLLRFRLEDARPLWSLAYLVGGMALTLGALKLLLNFKLLTRFGASLAFHAAWTEAVPAVLWRKLSLLQFGFYAGVPLMLALLVGLALSLGALSKGRVNMLSLWTCAVVALLLALAIVQGTNEVARLWLFTIPLITIAVAGLLRASNAATGRGARALAVTQGALALIMKVRQPW